MVSFSTVWRVSLGNSAQKNTDILSVLMYKLHLFRTFSQMTFHIWSIRQHLHKGPPVYDLPPVISLKSD